MEQLINLVVQKTGVSADAARGFVLKVLGLLKSQLPAAASSKLNAALGGALDQAEEAPQSPAEVIQEGGVPPAKAPAALTAILDQLKGQLPESMSGDVQKALGGEGGVGALVGKLAGMLGGK
jgi:hypothetical protein